MISFICSYGISEQVNIGNSHPTKKGLTNSSVCECQVYFCVHRIQGIFLDTHSFRFGKQVESQQQQALGKETGNPHSCGGYKSTVPHLTTQVALFCHCLLNVCIYLSSFNVCTHLSRKYESDLQKNLNGIRNHTKNQNTKCQCSVNCSDTLCPLSSWIDVCNQYT